MSSYPRMVELPPIGLDGHCTACGALPSRETGRCRCVTIHAASSATVDEARAALVEALAGNRDAPVIDRLNDFEAAVDSAAREEAYRQGYDSAMTDTEAKLRALRDLSDTGSPGPWVGNERGSIAWMIRETAGGAQIGNVILEEDAALIVAAVNYVRAALAATPAEGGEGRT